MARISVGGDVIDLAVPSRPVRLLLVETDAALVARFVSQLESAPDARAFSLSVIPHLAAAFREMENAGADLIVMDLDPSEDPGLTILTRLKAGSPDVPVVALLADIHQNHALQILEKGADDYLLAGQLDVGTLPSFLLRCVRRRTAEKALRSNERWFRLMIENVSDVIWVLEPGGVISYTSPSTERVIDHRPADLAGRNVLDYLHRDDRQPFLSLFEKTLQDGGSLPLVQFRLRKPDGRWVPMEGRGRVVQGPWDRPVCIVNSRDVSHRVKVEEELRSLSLQDELTRLHNRRAFVNYLEQQLKVEERLRKKGLTLLFIDLDGFKGINDNFGHKEGDVALVAAARLLKKTFRDADLVARLGGDEFAVFLTQGTDAIPVDVLKNRLQDAVEEWNQSEAKPYRLAMSVGVVHHQLKERVSAVELLRRADELMYEQKKNKKTRQRT